MNTVAAKKYLLVSEASDTGSRPSPILLEVIRETATWYYTKELYAIGLRDYSATYWKNRMIRWNKKTNARVGDVETHTAFVIQQVLDAAEMSKLNLAKFLIVFKD